MKVTDKLMKPAFGDHEFDDRVLTDNTHTTFGIITQTFDGVLNRVDIRN